MRLSCSSGSIFRLDAQENAVKALLFTERTDPLCRNRGKLGELGSRHRAHNDGATFQSSSTWLVVESAVYNERSPLEQKWCHPTCCETRSISASTVAYCLVSKIKRFLHTLDLDRSQCAQHRRMFTGRWSGRRRVGNRQHYRERWRRRH